MSKQVKVSTSLENHTEDLDRKPRETLIRLVAYVVSFLLLGFLVLHSLQNNWLNSGILLLFLCLNTFAQVIYSYHKNLFIFGFMQTTVVYLLAMYMLATGGSQGSGAIWIQALPILVFGVMRAQLAAALCACAALSIIALLFGPLQILYQAEYSQMVKIVCALNFVVISVITYLPTRIRERAVDSSERLTSELRVMASTDELTMLPNRRDMSLRMDFEVKRARRSPSTFSIVLYDIDYFKKINDSFGHDTGDIALQNFANLLQNRFRETDKVGRWGGEEFLVILPNTNLEEAIGIADEFRRVVCQASLIPNMPSRMVSVSAGVSSNEEEEDTESVLKLADKRLYQAKENGRNRIEPAPQPL